MVARPRRWPPRSLAVRRPVRDPRHRRGWAVSTGHRMLRPGPTNSRAPV